jgi:hypothetical protein
MNGEKVESNAFIRQLNTMITTYQCTEVILTIIRNIHAENNRPMLNCHEAYCSTDYSRSSLATQHAGDAVYTSRPTK